MFLPDVPACARRNLLLGQGRLLMTLIESESPTSVVPFVLRSGLSVPAAWSRSALSRWPLGPQARPPRARSPSERKRSSATLIRTRRERRRHSAPSREHPRLSEG